jgi:8-oxo-dGTP pyrophosphatase MutT (NUDIX family)
VTRLRRHNETSAGGVVFRRENGERRYLLIRDTYRHWSFPKGHLELGEDPEAAARREVAEEAGVRAVTVLASLPIIEWDFRFRNALIHKKCHFFLMETQDGHTEPQRAEGITECRWAPFAEAERMIGYENTREVLRHADELLARDDT